MARKQEAPIGAKARITTDPIPGSKKIYCSGSIHSQLKVPFRRIELSGAAQTSQNEPLTHLTVYDSSGPYTDPEVQIDVRRGLDDVRGPWIEQRGDTEQYEGRTRKPIDDGYRSLKRSEGVERFPGLKRSVRRAKSGKNVTQLHYARQGIVTAEME